MQDAQASSLGHDGMGAMLETFFRDDQQSLLSRNLPCRQGYGRPCSMIRQEWLGGTVDSLVHFISLRMSVENVVLRDEDEVEKDADVAQPQLDRIPNHSTPVRLKTGINQ